jgi:uncharacterized protein (DUF952 family)
MIDSADVICHVTDQVAIDQAAGGVYQCASLQTEGFIHCCTENQLAGVLQRYYQGVTGLKLLTINPALLSAGLVYENTVGGEEKFPHVYGPINMSAVIAITDIKQ